MTREIPSSLTLGDVLEGEACDEPAYMTQEQEPSEIGVSQDTSQGHKSTPEVRQEVLNVEGTLQVAHFGFLMVLAQ
eukprot:4995771-Amphidinium_carterae.4